MKRRTFYHLSLLAPYLLLAIAVALTYLANGFDIFTTSSEPNLLMRMMIFFAFSGIVWGPLYTWMVIVMLFWGRGRSTDEIRRMYLLSPVLLACSMGIPLLITDPATSGRFLLEGILRMNNMGFAIPSLLGRFSQDSTYIGAAWLFMAAICIVVGYTFVGIVVWVERSMKQRGKFKDESENPS